RAHKVHRVRDAKLGGLLRREPCLVVWSADVFTERHSYAHDRAIRRRARRRSHRVRINSRGKEDSDRHIGNQVMPCRVLQRRRDDLDLRILGYCSAAQPLRLDELLSKVIETMYRRLAVPPHGKRAAGRQRLDLTVERVRLGYVTEQEE